MEFFYLLVPVILNITYAIGFLGAQVLRKSTQHYFLGFNPGFLNFRIGKTKFTLGVYIPFIGLSRIYCIDTSGRKELFYPWRITNASLFQRLLLTYSGVASFFVFGAISEVLSVYTSTDRYISKDEVMKYGIYPSAAAQAVGFLPGDKVIAVNGKDYKDFAELIRPGTIFSSNTSYTILREGRESVLSLTDNVMKDFQPHELFLTINAPFSVGMVLEKSPAEKSGILSGDKILKVNGHPVSSYQEMNTYFESDEDGEVVLEIYRHKNVAEKFERKVALDEHRKIGISIDQKLEYKTQSYSLPESLSRGVVRFLSGIVVQFKILGRLLGFFVGQEKKTISGPIGVSRVSGAFNFSGIASYTSMYVAVVIMLNFLPLPKSALLEVIPLVYETVSRKSLSHNSFRKIRLTSIALLVALILWQFVSDLMQLF